MQSANVILATPYYPTSNFHLGNGSRFKAPAPLAIPLASAAGVETQVQVPVCMPPETGPLRSMGGTRELTRTNGRPTPYSKKSPHSSVEVFSTIPPMLELVEIPLQPPFVDVPRGFVSNSY